MRLRRQLKEEKQVHNEVQAAFVAEAAARDALSRLLHTCAACLRRRLAAMNGCSGAAQPAADASLADGVAGVGAFEPTASSAEAAAPALSNSSRETGASTARVQPGSRPPAAALLQGGNAARGTATPRSGTAAAAATPRSGNWRLATPRRHPPPMRQSRSAQDLRRLTQREQNTPADALSSAVIGAEAAAALAATCGVWNGAQQLDAGNGITAASCAARLHVVQWLAEHAFGAERMTAMQTCQSALDAGV